MRQQVNSFFEQFIYLKEKDILNIEELTTVKHLSKNGFNLIHGKVQGFVAFINRGAFRTFYSVNGHEQSNNFSQKMGFVKIMISSVNNDKLKQIKNE